MEPINKRKIYMLDIVFSNWGQGRLNNYIVMAFLQYTGIAKKWRQISHFLNQDLTDIHYKQSFLGAVPVFLAA